MVFAKNLRYSNFLVLKFYQPFSSADLKYNYVFHSQLVFKANTYIGLYIFLLRILELEEYRSIDKSSLSELRDDWKGCDLHEAANWPLYILTPSRGRKTDCDRKRFTAIQT